MGNIAIITPGGVGDILLGTSVLKYREKLWPGKDIVWYCTEKHKYVLSKIKNIKEIRTVEEKGGKWGWFAPDAERAFEICVWGQTDGRRFKFPSGTLMVDKPKLLFENQTSMKFIDPWYPCLDISEEDKTFAIQVVNSLSFKKTVMIETAFFSFQSFLTSDVLLKIILEIRRIWGDCNFLFVSRENTFLPSEEKGVLHLPSLSLSEVVALFNCVDAFIGVNSGVSVAVCSWAADIKIPRLELIKNPLLSFRKISRGPVSTALNKKELFEKLPNFLNGIYL